MTMTLEQRILALDAAGCALEGQEAVELPAKSSEAFGGAL